MGDSSEMGELGREDIHASVMGGLPDITLIDRRSAAVVSTGVAAATGSFESAPTFTRRFRLRFFMRRYGSRTNGCLDSARPEAYTFDNELCMVACERAAAKPKGVNRTHRPNSCACVQRGRGACAAAAAGGARLEKPRAAHEHRHHTVASGGDGLVTGATVSPDTHLRAGPNNIGG